MDGQADRVALCRILTKPDFLWTKMWQKVTAEKKIQSLWNSKFSPTLSSGHLVFLHWPRSDEMWDQVTSQCQDLIISQCNPSVRREVRLCWRSCFKENFSCQQLFEFCLNSFAASPGARWSTWASSWIGAPYLEVGYQHWAVSTSI